MRYHPDRKGPDADTVAMQHVTRARDELLAPLDARKDAAREEWERAQASHSRPAHTGHSGHEQTGPSGGSWANFEQFMR